MIRKVIQDPNPILHKKTLPVTRGFESEFMQQLICDMKDTLIAQDGVGLAAPQVNEALSIFIIPEELAPKVRTASAPLSLVIPLKPTVFINPEIIYYSCTREIIEEGCLSVRGIFKPTFRSLEVKLKAFDHRGRKFSVYAKGLLARIFQHETDHLNGVLFIEKS